MPTCLFKVDDDFCFNLARIPVFVRPGFYEGEHFKPETQKVHPFVQGFESSQTGFFRHEFNILAALIIVLGKLSKYQ